MNQVLGGHVWGEHLTHRTPSLDLESILHVLCRHIKLSLLPHRTAQSQYSHLGDEELGRQVKLRPSLKVMLSLMVDGSSPGVADCTCSHSFTLEQLTKAGSPMLQALRAGGGYLCQICSGWSGDETQGLGWWSSRKETHWV